MGRARSIAEGTADGRPLTMSSGQTEQASGVRSTESLGKTLPTGCRASSLRPELDSPRGRVVDRRALRRALAHPSRGASPAPVDALELSSDAASAHPPHPG